MAVFSRSHRSSALILDTNFAWSHSFRGLDMKLKQTSPWHADSQWFPQEVGWVKMNSDGAVPAPGIGASIEGVLRDSNVNWL